VRIEWEGALDIKKRIIPIYKKVEYIPISLRGLIRMKFDAENVENTVNEIYQTIKKSFKLITKKQDPILLNTALDIKNLQCILIQDSKIGIVIFNIDFFQHISDIVITSAFLKAIDDWGKIEFKAGRAISIDFEEQHVMGNFIM